MKWYKGNFKHSIYFLLACITLVLIKSCTTSQINQSVQVILRPNNLEEKLTVKEVKEGLRQSMEKGMKLSVQRLNRQGGFLYNGPYRIEIPKALTKVEKVLIQSGNKATVQQFENMINQTASKATRQSLPLFINEIDRMKINKAFSILKSYDHAATDYLKEETAYKLRELLYPIVKNNLNQEQVMKYYMKALERYNNTPFVQPIHFDLYAYITNQVVESIFTLMAIQEEQLRNDPSYRDTALLQKVFAYQD